MPVEIGPEPILHVLQSNFCKFTPTKTKKPEHELRAQAFL